MFNTTASVTHITPLPRGSQYPPSLISLLHSHIYFIECNPHTTHHELIPASSLPSPAPELPPDREVRDLKGSEGPTLYSVTDRVHTLPAGLWDSDVVSTYEFFNTVSGIFVRIRSPLNVVMETEWIVRRRGTGTGTGESGSGSDEDKGEGGGDDGVEESDEWELVEDVVIKCSRFLVGVVKSTCENGWESIHETMMNKLKEATA